MRTIVAVVALLRLTAAPAPSPPLRRAISPAD